MKKIDMRYDKELFSKFIDKKFNSYIHDEFFYTNTVTGIVGFVIDGKNYKMTNQYETVDFLGISDEATISDFTPCNLNEFRSLTNSPLQNNKVDEIIINIKIINDHFEIYNQGSQRYDWWETRAVIFQTVEREYSFEKQDCWFSQEIEINKGYDLIGKIEDGKNIQEDFVDSDNDIVQISREIITVE